MYPFSVEGARVLSFATQAMNDVVKCINSVVLNSMHVNYNVTTIRQIPPVDNAFASIKSISICDSKTSPYNYLSNAIDLIRVVEITHSPGSLRECTGQELLTFSNATSCENEIQYDHNFQNDDDGSKITLGSYCINSCKITNYSFPEFQEFLSNMKYYIYATSTEEENFGTSAPEIVEGVIVRWIMPAVAAVGTFGLALYGIYRLWSHCSFAVNSVDVGTNANTSVKNLNAEKMPTDFLDNNEQDFLDNNEQQHLYEDPQTFKYAESAYDDTARPISGQDVIMAEAVV